MTPVWLLDIDGVVNAIMRSSAAWDTSTDHLVPGSDGKEWRIRASRHLVGYLHGVHDAGRAEIRWHTTWQHDAWHVSRALGLPEFPVALAPEFSLRPLRPRPAGWWWKPAAVWRALDEGRPVIWTDDAINLRLTEAERAAMCAAGRVLLVSPRAGTGLDLEDLLRIDLFVDGGS